MLSNHGIINRKQNKRGEIKRKIAHEIMARGFGRTILLLSSADSMTGAYLNHAVPNAQRRKKKMNRPKAEYIASLVKGMQHSFYSQKRHDRRWFALQIMRETQSPTSELEQSAITNYRRFRRSRRHGK